MCDLSCEGNVKEGTLPLRDTFEVNTNDERGGARWLCYSCCFYYFYRSDDVNSLCCHGATNGVLLVIVVLEVSAAFGFDVSCALNEELYKNCVRRCLNTLYCLPCCSGGGGITLGKVVEAKTVFVNALRFDACEGCYFYFVSFYYFSRYSDYLYDLCSYYYYYYYYT